MSRRRAQNQNFDSLLDTMANVVGILVVVLAFTQIHVGQAVRRIHEGESSASTSEDAKAGAMRESTRLERAIASMPAESGKMQQVAEHLAGLHPTAKAPMTAEEVVSAMLRESRKQTQLGRALSPLRAEEQQMQMRLSEARAEFENAVHRVRLPDPRPAPLGTQEMTFFCRYGRVKHVDMEELDRRRVTGIEAARLAGRRSAGSLASSLVRYFYNRDIGDESFRWRLQEQANNQIYVTLAFRNHEVGERRDTIARIESRFRRSLYAADPNRRYIRFHVWNDSFSVYLRARSIAEEMGYSVGFKLSDSEHEFGGYLGWGAPLHDPIPID